MDIEALVYECTTSYVNEAVIKNQPFIHLYQCVHVVDIEALIYECTTSYVNEAVKSNPSINVCISNGTP